MNITKITLATAALVFLALSLSNCSDGDAVSTNNDTFSPTTNSTSQATDPASPPGNTVGVSPGCVGWLRNVTVAMDPPEWVKSSRIGQVQRLSAKIIKGTDRDTGNQTVPEGCRQVVWDTSDPQVATVSSEGIVRALRRGNVTITATDLSGNHSKGVDLVIESGVPSDQPVNMYTTWTARRVQHAVIQVNDRIFTERNALLDEWCCKYPAPWLQGGIEKYQWYNDRVGLLSDVVDGAGSFRVVERADEWTVLAKDNAVDFQLFRRKIILLDDNGGLRLKISKIDDPWNAIASSGIRQFRAHMDWPDEVITAVREDGLLFTKVINDDDVNQPWVSRNVGGQVERFKVYDQYIAVLRADGVFGVFDKNAASWTPLVDSGTQEFALSALGIFVLFEDGRLRGKVNAHTNWVDLATDVGSFKVDGRLVAAQQYDGRFRVKKELNGTWRVLSAERVLGYALQVDETGEYIGYVPSDRVLRVVEGVDGTPVATHVDATDLLPPGEIGHITVVADVREPPTRTISIPYPGGSRAAAPPEYGLSSYLRSYPDDQEQCMRDNTDPWLGTEQNPGDGQTHICRWVSESPTKCLFEDGPGLPNVVTCYGRFCGGGVPNSADWDWANTVGSLDSFDQVCLHHDKAGIYYTGGAGAFNACIVKYGIDHGRLTYNGRQVVEGDPDWSTRWATMWNIWDVVQNYTDQTAVCVDSSMADFIDETASPRTQDPPD